MNVLDRAHWSLIAELHRRGSLTGAASALNITQSAASQRLHEAERRLGVSLTRRQGRALVLTEAGDIIARAGSEAISALRSAETDAIWQGKRSNTRLRLAWTHFDAPRLALLLDQICADTLPDVELEFVRFGVEDAEESLLFEEVDLAITPRRPSREGLESHIICADRLVAVFSRTAGLNLELARVEDFDSRSFLSYGVKPEPGQEYERFFDNGKRFGGTLRSVGSTELICGLIATNSANSSILPRLCVDLSIHRPSLELVDLDSEPFELEWQVAVGVKAPPLVCNAAAAVAHKLSKELHARFGPLNHDAVRPSYHRDDSPG